MNAEQATEIIDLIKTGAIPYEWPDDLMKQAALHLRPLPYEYTLRRVQQWSALPKKNADGQEVSKFCNSLPEVLNACGVSTGARHDLSKAAHEGGEMMADLRNIDGLTYVGPGDPIPQGCYEYLALNNLPIPMRAVQAALPSAPPSSGERPPIPESARQLVKLFDYHQPPKKREPKTVEVKDVLALIEAQLGEEHPLYEAFLHLSWHVDSTIQVYRDQITELKDRAQELEDAYVRSDDAPVEGVIEACCRLVKKVGFHEQGMVLDAVLRAVLPALTDLKVRFYREDPHDDESPVVKMTAVALRPRLERADAKTRRTPKIVPTRPPKLLKDVLR